MTISGDFQQGRFRKILNWWDKMNEEETLEIYKLIISSDEIEFEATDNVSDYLIERASFYANKLGREGKKLKEFDIVKDVMSNGWVVIYMCERYWK